MDFVGERFTLEAATASGGMGIVHRAVDQTTGKHVALKLMRAGDSDQRRRFEREGEILASLEHPAIVRYVAHGVTARGEPYLAMDWIDGESLYARLARAGLTVDETVALGRRIADGLGHAHRAGTIHRDIKPSNIMLPGGDLLRALVVDFGVARVRNQTLNLTATGMTLGTPSYMAPEQARGARTIDARADVFSLGCVLYECVAGRRAYQGRNALAVIAKVVLWDPPRLITIVPSIPPELDALVAILMSKDTLSRPTDGIEVAACLARFEPTTRAEGSGPVRGGTSATIVGQLAGARAGELFACVIAGAMLAGADGTAEPLDDGQLAERRALVERCLAGTKITAEVLHDGSVVALAGDPAEPPAAVVSRAVAFARALARALPGLAFAVCSGLRQEREGSDGVLDLTAAVIEKEAMAAIFAGVSAPARPAGAIRVDERTATLLRDESLVRIGNASYVTSK